MSFRKTISWCLLPLTVWYPIVVGLRNLLFALGIRKQQVTPITSIGVGNLSTGGTGKTPHVEYLIRLLSDSFNTALLSRGYKRKSKGFVIGESDNPSATLLGDEPAMIARKYPHITTAVCEKRNEGLRRLSALDNPPQLVILDDVYQHRQTKPTINILLTEYARPYYNDRVLPFGDLRESRCGHRRANIIIVTKSPEKLNPIAKHSIIASLKTSPYQKIFFSYLRYGEPTSLDGQHHLAIDSLNSVLIVTGIAHPEPMVRHIGKQCHRYNHLAYRDHHNFSLADIKEMRSRLEQLPGERKAILTTEKDLARLCDARLRDAINGLPIYYLPIEVAFHNSKEYTFDDTVRSIIKENISFLDRINSFKAVY